MEQVFRAGVPIRIFARLFILPPVLFNLAAAAGELGDWYILGSVDWVSLLLA